MIRDDPADPVVVEGIGAPEHHQLGVLHDHRPCGGLVVDLQRPDHIGHHDLRGAGGVVAGGIHEAAFERHHPVQQVAAVVQLAGALPAIRSGKARGGAVDVVDPLEFFRDQVERLVPGDAHEVAVAASLRIGAGPVLEERAPHHRIFDPCRRVDRVHDALEHRGRVGVLFPGPDADKAPILHLGAKRAEVRSGEDLGFGAGRAGARVQQRGAGNTQRTGGKSGFEQSAARYHRTLQTDRHGVTPVVPVLPVLGSIGGCCRNAARCAVRKAVSTCALPA